MGCKCKVELRRGSVRAMVTALEKNLDAQQIGEIAKNLVQEQHPTKSLTCKVETKMSSIVDRANDFVQLVYAWWKNKEGTVWEELSANARTPDHNGRPVELNDAGYVGALRARRVGLNFKN